MKRALSIVPFTLLLACSDPFEAESTRSYISLATGGEHTCAVTVTGDAYCWGRGADGELGIGIKESRSTPALVTGGIQFKEVTAGDNHSCGIAAEGRGYCWGWNAFYQRGNPTDPRDAEPVPLTIDMRFTTISAGAHHTCAIGVDTLAYCWGYNRYGQIGDATTSVAVAPKFVTGQIKFAAISSGAWHTCALTAGGTAFCWGRNDYGQLGAGTDVNHSSVPLQVVADFPFAQIDAGATHTCGVARTGRLYCWGSNEFGELGNGGAFSSGLAAANVPTPTSALFPNGEMISAGVSHTCAALGADTRCWGRGLYGQLANGSFGDHYVPQPVRLLGINVPVTRLATGGRTHACAISEGTIFCWGTGAAGQLGVIRSRIAVEPQRVGD